MPANAGNGKRIDKLETGVNHLCMITLIKFLPLCQNCKLYQWRRVVLRALVDHFFSW